MDDATPDNCLGLFNPDQADADGDGVGDARDARDGRHADGDGVPDGPVDSEPLCDRARAAKAERNSS